MFGSLAGHLRYALIIILVVVIIILLSKWTGSNSTSTALLIKGSKGGAAQRLQTQQQQQQQQQQPPHAASNLAVLQKLMKESREWAAETESPSISPVGQLVNATYALAYAQASQALASGPEIKSATSVEVEPFVADMKVKQTEAVQYLASHFPSIV
jgi:Sec-independent protein translocase protein TatA